QERDERRETTGHVALCFDRMNRTNRMKNQLVVHPVHPVRPVFDEERQVGDHAARLSARSSTAMRPSRSTTRRFACAAMSDSCVTTTIVCPSACSAANSAMISSDVFESRLPVG